MSKRIQRKYAKRKAQRNIVGKLNFYSNIYLKNVYVNKDLY
jgi:hypothetical protein